MTLQDILNLINQSTSIEEFATNNQLKIAIDEKTNRYILNYDEAKLNTPKGYISDYCRGLTLYGTPNNYKIITKGFNRFYNNHENPEHLVNAKQIDYTKPFQVQFKYDGSIILQYYHNGKVYVNTRGSFAQSNICAILDKSWEEVFNECDRTQLEDTFLIFPDYTFVYELCTPYNQIVEQYPTSFAKCLAIFRRDGTEVQNSFEGQIYDCQSKEEVIELLNTLHPTQEGFVIAQWDKDTNTYIRKKFKTQTWLDLFNFKNDGLSSNAKLWNVVLNGEKDEVASVFVHLKDTLDEMYNQYQTMLKEANLEYDRVKHIENQKEFALAINNMEYKYCYFLVRLGKATIIEVIKNYIKKNKA